MNVPTGAAQSLRIATCNVENLFRRPRLLSAADWANGRDAIEAYSTLVDLLERTTYSAADKVQIADLLQKYDVLDNTSDTRPFKVQQRNDALAKLGAQGQVVVTAKGRADWVGWVELVRDDISWPGVKNTARVLAEVDADIVVTVEVEDRQALQRFNDQVLSPILPETRRYPYNMLVDGNDARGIDIGLLSRHPVTSVRPHLFDGPPGQPVFSRDCPEFEVPLPGGASLWILGNHFKSKGYGKQTDSARRREAQAARVAEIYAQALTRSPYVVVAGDLNDSPDSVPLQLLGETGLRDVMTHDSYKGLPGTYGPCKSRNQKIDYVLLSPALWERLRAVGVERHGIWAPRTFPHFDTVESRTTQASDHAAVFADLDLSGA
ncbi:hypothetical protein GCM10010129_00200 [Streptomyces fumigatiscleroticus]|nr:hypothetical protein GCM10010129_00200 [Streptomyces fumigatiscleroticus]